MHALMPAMQYSCHKYSHTSSGEHTLALQGLCHALYSVYKKLTEFIF